MPLKRQILPTNLSICFLWVFYHQSVFVPEDLGGDQHAGWEVIREDLVVVADIFCGVVKLSSSHDAPRQPGK